MGLARSLVVAVAGLHRYPPELSYAYTDTCNVSILQPMSKVYPCAYRFSYECVGNAKIAVWNGCSGVFSCGALGRTHCTSESSAKQRTQATQCNCDQVNFERLKHLQRHFAYGSLGDEEVYVGALSDGIRTHEAMRRAPDKVVKRLAQQTDCFLRWATDESVTVLPLLMRQLTRDQRRTGVFLEIGAFDGVHGSNTYALERCLGWTGLLIEANPSSFRDLLASGRNAAMVHAAACENGRTVFVSNLIGSSAAVATVKSLTTPAYLHRWQGHLAKSGEVPVPCRELRTLVAANVHGHVDFGSIDVQGAEEAALNTSDIAAFRVLMIEAEGTDREKNGRVRLMLKGAGMKMLASGGSWIRGPGGKGHYNAYGNAYNDLFAHGGHIYDVLSDWKNITTTKTHAEIIIDALVAHHLGLNGTADGDEVAPAGGSQDDPKSGHKVHHKGEIHHSHRVHHRGEGKGSHKVHHKGPTWRPDLHHFIARWR